MAFTAEEDACCEERRRRGLRVLRGRLLIRYFSREDFENDQWEETKHNAKLAAEAVAGIVIAALSFTAALVWTIIKCNTPKRASAAEIRRAAGGHADLTEQGPMGTELGTMGDAGDDGVRSAERL